MRKRSIRIILAVPLLFSSFAAANLRAQDPVFSEDFESGQIDSRTWELRVKGAATIDVVEGEAAHGRYSLRIHYPDRSQPGYAFIVAPFLPDVVRQHFFGRAYIKIAGAPQSRVGLLFAGRAGWPFAKFDEIAVDGGSFQLPPGGNGQALPEGKWFLLEWEVNDDPNHINVWVDGKESRRASLRWPTGAGNARVPTGGFEEFGFGVRAEGEEPRALDVFYDDIAIGTARIGDVQWQRRRKIASLGPPGGARPK